MKKTIALLTALVLLAVCFTGCGKSGGGEAVQQKEELYSMVVFSKGSEYFNWTYAGFSDAAKAMGAHIKTELVGPAEVDAAAEAKALEQLIAKKPNGIVVTSTYNPLPCYYISAIIYLALNIILGKGLNIFEGRLRKSER